MIKINLIIICCLILSCSTKEDSNINQRKILIPDTYNTFVDTKTFSKNLELIQLDSKPQAFIGKVDKLLFHENFFYILDKNYAASVKIFDRSGKYISHIDKQFFNNGSIHKGLIDFADIDIHKDTLYVLDGRNQKVYLFSLKGKFLKEKNLLFYAYSLSVMDWGMVFFKNLTKNKIEDIKYSNDIIVTDINLRVINTFKPFKELLGKQYDRLCVSQPLSKSGRDVLFRQFFSDTIWRIHKNKLEMKAVMTFWKGSKTEKMRVLFNSQPYTQFLKIFNDQYNDIAFGGDVIIDTKNYLALHFGNNLKTNWFLEDKIKNNSFSTKELRFENMPIPFPLYGTDEYLISVLDEDRLTSINYQDASQKFKTIASNVIDKGYTYLFLLNL